MYGDFYFKSKGGGTMKHVSSYTHTQKQLNDYANQKNCNSNVYKAMLDNRANQLNPNNFRYYLSRMQNKKK